MGCDGLEGLFGLWRVDEYKRLEYKRGKEKDVW